MSRAEQAALGHPDTGGAFPRGHGTAGEGVRGAIGTRTSPATMTLYPSERRRAAVRLHRPVGIQPSAAQMRAFATERARRAATR
jgi:hypothetical protein